MSEFVHKNLTEVCDILYGYPFDSSHFSLSPDDMPLIRIRDVKEGKTSTYYNGNYPKEYIIHKGDYLIGMDGEFNISSWKSDDALLNQRVCKISSKTQSVSIRYVYRFLTKELKIIEDETPFATVKHLSAKKLNQIIIPVPPIKEQERIVSELDLLSGIIEKKKEQLKEYDKLAQSIFYDMFGDPITNEKGWEVKKLANCCKNCDSQRKPITAKDRIKGIIPYYGASGVVDFVKDYIFDGEYLLISEDGANLIIRSTPIAFRIKGKTWVNNHAHVLQFDALFKQIFIEYSINLRDISSIITGCAQPKLTQAAMNNLNIPYPPFSLQQSFAEKVEAIEKQKALVQQSISETQTLFDSTMDKYFG